ncbi:MAG: Sbal_3080 family lipoprotein [Burkholderiales bacterium]
MNKLATMVILAALLSGCAATTSIQRVRAKLDQVCIERNPQVEVYDLLEVIEANLRRHKIETRVFDVSPAPCPYRLTYDASRRWDLKAFLSDAQILLQHDHEIIGRAEFHWPAGVFGAGGPNPEKWRGTAFKIDPIMDQMLADIEK